MSEHTLPSSAPSGDAARPGIVSTGWLAANSTLGTTDERKLGRSFIASLILHGGLLGLVLLVFAVTPQSTIDQITHPIQVVYLQTPGPGGGGGGSAAAAPPKKLEIAKPKAPPPTVPPVIPPPPIPPPPPPAPLTAPVTTNADISQATGASSVSLAALGGGGRGGGVGAGAGVGVGPGNTAGFGGGAYKPGSGISYPTLLTRVRPTYTPDGMRARITGEAVVEAVVLADGTVGDVRIVHSLDKVYGLDNEALKAAKKWLFKPGTDATGKPVPVIVQISLQFNIF